MNVALVVAGGTGERFGAANGKQLAVLAGRPMLRWTLDAMQAAASIEAVVVTFDAEGVDALAERIEGWGVDKVTAIVPGGRERQHSVRAGLQAVPSATEVVAVHDGARPLVLTDDIDACVDALPGWDGVVLGRPVVDTVKAVGTAGLVDRTLDRSRLWQAETPQVFGLSTLLEAHARAEAAGLLATDDAALVEQAGGRVRMVAATGPNIKVTVKEDALLAEAVLGRREAP